MDNQREIKYLNKDFNSLKAQLVEFAKNYFPDTYSDFSPASPGMMFIEMAAYVGDILSFYQDIGIQETFLKYAKNPANLYAIAYMMGYRPKITTVSTTNLTVTQEVNAILSGSVYVPDWNSACILRENSEIVSTDKSGTSFLTRDPLDFSFSSSYNPTLVTLSTLDSNGRPSKFTLSKKVKAYSGQIKTITKSFGTYKKYQTFEISDNDIVGILDIVDLDGNVWSEVPFLGQDTIFVRDQNIGNINADTPYVLKLEKVSRRFVTRFTENGNLEVQFGAGMYASDEDEQEFLPNPLSLSADSQEMSSDKYDVAYDPSNFLFSNSYGLAPVNTTLTIRYIVGGGVQSNVSANTITKPKTLLVSTRLGGVLDTNTLSFTNEEAASGGSDGDTLEEVRQNALRTFAEQKRIVTLEDFNIRALAMPPEYGSVSKAYAVSDSLFNVTENYFSRNPLNISLYVLSYDADGKLGVMTDTTKNNLKTYLSEYVMLTDTVDIKDAFIVNIGVQYDIVLRAGYSASDVLLKCTRIIQDYLNTSKRVINEPLNLSELNTLIAQVKGVQIVKNIKIVNKVGGKYSKYAYDIENATKRGIIYPSYDPCIFEVKYPDIDIEGRITTL